MADYYILIDNVQQGPFPAEKLKEKGVTAETFVWRKGMSEWVKARDEPELRSYIRWQPPSRPHSRASQTAATQTPQPVSPAMAASSALENAQEKASDSPASAKAKKEHDRPKNVSLASRWEDLKDWFLLLEPLQQKILVGIAAAVVIVPLLIWGISSLGGSKRPKYPVVQRSKDDDIQDRLVQRKTQPPQKAPPPKQPVNKVAAKKQAELANKKEPSLPPGRLTEEYYRLVRNLSFDRLFQKQRTQLFPRQGRQPSAWEKPEAIVGHYHRLAETAKDETLRQLALRAATLWKTLRNKPKGNRAAFPRDRSVLAGSRHTRKDGLRPDLLHHRLRGRYISSADYQLELTHEELWKEILRHMQAALDRAAPLTPALARLTNRTQGAFNSSPLQWKAENTSGETLYHVTLRIKLEAPWGVSVTRYFYRDIWKEKTFWTLPEGHLWGKEGLRQTTVATLSIWSDNGVMPPQEFPLTERLPHVVRQLEDFCREELNRGYYDVPEQVAAGLKQHRQVPEVDRQTAEHLLQRALRLKQIHRSVIAATKPERAYIGLWRFGRYEGELAIEFLPPEDSVPRKVASFRSSGSSRDSVRRSAVSARWFHPERPTEYKIYRGFVEYSPQADTFLLFLSGRSGHLGLDGAAARLPNSSRNYLLKGQQRTFVFALQDEKLWGAAAQGDSFCFVPVEGDDWQNQLAELKKRHPQTPPSNVLLFQAGVSVQPVLDEAALPATSQTKPWPLLWSPGEIRRFDAASQPKSAPRPIEQVFFSRNGAVIFGVAGDTAIAWQTRNGEERTRFRTGQPVVSVPIRQWLLVPGRQGVRVFDARRGQPLRGRRDQFTGASDVLSVAGNGRRVISGSTDGTVRVWDLTGRVLMKGKHNTAVTAVALNDDGTLAASATRDQRLTVWKVQDKKNFVRSFDSGERPVAALRFSGEGRLLAISAPASLSASSPPASFPPRGNNPAGGLQGRMEAKEYVLQIFSVETGEKQASLRIAGPVTALAVSADWRWALMGTSAGPLLLWNLQRGEMAGRLVGHTKPARSLCFSDDLRFALSGGEDGYAILWGLPLVPSGPAVKSLANNASARNSPKKVAQKPPIPVTPLTRQAAKRMQALKKVQLAMAAAKAGRRIRAAGFLQEAEAIAGDDPLVRREMEKVRTVLGTN